jgi:hypothetical protein
MKCGETYEIFSHVEYNFQIHKKEPITDRLFFMHLEVIFYF